jgi:hypothetical protein
MFVEHFDGGDPDRESGTTEAFEGVGRRLQETLKEGTTDHQKAENEKRRRPTLPRTKKRPTV